MKKKDLCKQCGQPIVWRKNVGNVGVSFDPVPTETGSHVYIEGTMCRFDESNMDIMRHHSGPRFQQHSASCPKKPKEAK